MEEEIIGAWVKVYESSFIMEAELVEARLKDEGIEYQVKNKMDLGYNIKLGSYFTYNAAMPVKIFVHPQDEIKALNLINEDKSELLDNPDLDFGKTED